MNCKYCGAELHDSDVFCPGCGKKIEFEPEVVICAQCGTVLREGAEFCHKCGTKIIDHKSEENHDYEKPQKHSFWKRMLDDEEEYENDEDENYDDNEDDNYEDDEYDDNEEYDSEDEEEYEEVEESHFVRGLTLFLGILILLAAVAIAFMLWNSYNGQETETTTQQTESTTSESEQSESSNEKTEQSSGEITIISNVNIRAKANTDSAVLGVAKSGETYEYSELVDSWYHITTSSGQDGYIYEDYAKKE